MINRKRLPMLFAKTNLISSLWGLADKIKKGEIFMGIAKKYYNGKRVLSNTLIPKKMQVQRKILGIPFGWTKPKMKFKKWS